MASGLDAVSSNFMPGEIVAPTDATPAAKNPLDDMARFIPAGGPKGSKGVLDASDSADILAKMEEFIKQRSQPKEPTILGGIGNALSAASMSLYHPEAYVQKQKNEADLAQQNAKDTLDMQMQIAQFKAAQEQQKAYAKRLENVFGSGEQGQPQAATPGQPQTAASVVTTSGGQKFSVNDLPPAIRAAAYAQPDFASMMKVIDTWAQKNAEQAQKLSNDMTVTGTELVTVNGPNGTQYQTTRAEAPALIKRLWPNEPWSPTTNPQPNIADVKAQAPAGKGGYKGVAADVNNPTGIGGAGNFTQYETPQQGVQASLDLNGQYIRGEGPMKGITPTVENMTSVWVNGKPGTNPPGYSTFVKQELSKAGVKLNADSTVPNTPEAVKAMTAARIKFESGKNADKFLPYLDASTTTPATSSTTSTTTPATTSTTTPATTGTKDQIEKLIAEITKPDPRAPTDQWNTYKKQISDLRAKLASAPIESAQKAEDIISSQKATNSAAEEKALHESAGKFSTDYMGTIGELEKIANDPNNEKLFAIGNKKDPFSKAASLGKFVGMDKDQMKELYKQYNPDIKDEDLAKMEQFDKGASQITAAYVHQTFPGRILASELTLGGTAKGVGINNQRESNAASLASIRTIYELQQKLEKGLSDYRATHGANASYQDFKESQPFQNIVDASAKDLHDKFPKYYPYTDKFAKYKK